MGVKARIYTKEIMDYLYEKDGWLYWKNDRGNLKCKNCLAGCLNELGYYVVMINNKSYYNHRILYQFYHNILLNSTDIVDHHDRNPQNNSKENLRIDPNSENCCNRKTPKNNLSTGLKNISIIKNKSGSGYYHIKIVKNGKRVFSKCYRIDKFNLYEVIEIRDEQLKIHHGDFYSLG